MDSSKSAESLGYSPNRFEGMYCQMGDPSCFRVENLPHLVPLQVVDDIPDDSLAFLKRNGRICWR